MEGSPLVASRPVLRIATARDGRVTVDAGGEDRVAVERPLEIRVDGRALAVTLRTPGHDPELVLGFLASEGVVRAAADVRSVRLTTSARDDEADVAEVELAPSVTLDWSRLERHFASSAACGLCGRARLEALRQGLAPAPAAGRTLDPAALAALPERLRAFQSGFAASGGLHAAALCADDLGVQVVREDIGRHNAVDKVCGWRLAAGEPAAATGLLWVSGRAGAELVLKAARAGIPVMAAVGAPTTLAIALAEAAGMTLVGFLREGRMNVYGGGDRLAPHGRGTARGMET